MSETAEDVREELVLEGPTTSLDEQPLEGPTEPLDGRDVEPTEVRPTPEQPAERPPSFLRRNRRTLVILGIAAAIVAVIIALSSAKAADKPSVNQASADVANLSPAPSYDPGEFGCADSLTLDTVDYVEVVRESHTCTATGELIYAGDAVSVRQRVAVNYIRANNGGWMLDGDAEVTKLTWSATAGADPDRVLAQADVLLQKADIQAHDATGGEVDLDAPTLYALYRNATCTVASEEFDPEGLTDTIVLHFDDAGTFVSHSCDLTVMLRFRTGTGQWELASCTADDHAFDEDYSALVGSWEGTFTTQDNDGHGCYAARTTPLVLNIDTVGVGTDGVITVAGNLSALVHHHGSLTTDADSTTGDELVEGETFTGTLERGAYGYVCRCTTAESADGTLLLEIDFGTEVSASSASATLTTSYEHDEGVLFILYIPYQVTSTFADNYLLAKVPEE